MMISATRSLENEDHATVGLPCHWWMMMDDCEQEQKKILVYEYTSSRERESERSE